MTFSYSAVWDDTMQLLRRHGSLLLAVAGVFFLLPGLLVAYVFPQPTSASGEDVVALMVTYYQEHWVWLLLSSIASMIGTIALYLLLFDRQDRTVGGAIAAALPILPFYFLMSLLSGLAIGLGLSLFVLPGLYLLGRLAPASAVMVAEDKRSPFAALSGSWSLTRKRGWKVAGLLLIVVVVGYVLSFIVTAVLGSVFLLALGRDGLGGLLNLILRGAVSAVFITVLIVLLAAIYRALRGTAEPVTGT